MEDMEFRDINEFKDRLFDVINDTDNLSLQDLIFEDKKDIIQICLEDGSVFEVRIRKV